MKHILDRHQFKIRVSLAKDHVLLDDRHIWKKSNYNSGRKDLHFRLGANHGSAIKLIDATLKLQISTKPQ